MTTDLQQMIIDELSQNQNKLSWMTFIEDLVTSSQIKYHQLTPRVKICILTLKSGHEIIGKYQVLDANDYDDKTAEFESLGDAKKQIWELASIIAKRYV